MGKGANGFVEHNAAPFALSCQKVESVPTDMAAETAAGMEEEFLVPIASQRELQLKLVLRRNVSSDIAVLMDGTCTQSSAASVSTRMDDPFFQAGRESVFIGANHA